jgi:hypothetical protein
MIKLTECVAFLFLEEFGSMNAQLFIFCESALAFPLQILFEGKYRLPPPLNLDLQSERFRRVSVVPAIQD